MKIKQKLIKVIYTIKSPVGELILQTKAFGHTHTIEQ